MIGVSQAKAKTLFWIFFIILGGMNTVLIIYIIDHLIPLNKTGKTIIALVIFIVAIIPLTGFLAEKVTKISLRLGLEKRRNFIIFLAIIVMIPIMMIFNENREKDLDEVIQFQTKNVDYIIIGNEFENRTVQEKHAVELKELLNQYRVKKMKDSEWDPDVSKEKGYYITIYSKGKPIIASIYENRILSVNRGNYYHVLNGPIDLTWFDELYEELRQD
ncbi:hypothetical protein [Ureibacillus manganicus]|uniref:Uncharacterized protein n=1 Tax=Ureibacillus manganicus DSM 26584 TaxID=1384049 RepID=A0A0A3I8F9_9BACL|nr:hypothetical protein [Ureibacillus manganicus]KGR79038.1 hypothetical protein CD29_08490 [Ureibacillus manganicus DSM 26584]